MDIYNTLAPQTVSGSNDNTVVAPNHDKLCFYEVAEPRDCL